MRQLPAHEGDAIYYVTSGERPDQLRAAFTKLMMSVGNRPYRLYVDRVFTIDLGEWVLALRALIRREDRIAR